jgi:hypothetical protein
MKIGIFGCSYACPSSNSGMPNFNSNGRSWMKILTEDFNQNITTYGLSGSSVYYSYLNFKENYKKYDKIVFLGTYPDRKYCPNLNMQHITFSHTLKEFKVSDHDELIQTYYKYFHNIKEADDMRELMITDVKKIGGNTTLYIDTPTTLGEVSMMEELKRINKEKSPDHRWCHISNENNYIFASQINDWLKGNPFVFDFSSFKKPTVEELKSYYELT